MPNSYVFTFINLPDSESAWIIADFFRPEINSNYVWPKNLRLRKYKAVEFQNSKNITDRKKYRAEKALFIQLGKTTSWKNIIIFVLFVQ